MNPPRKSRRVGRFSGKRPQVKKAVVKLHPINLSAHLSYPSIVRKGVITEG
jgi:hypothetical protein